ncbi:transcriptional regulator PtsJ [Massilia terrae]|uniref:Transcriptional regulator PtsJ n=1 Tax=Massilia terrae TaxID=1811224 RepID=A0ABT2CZQ0_9BURK|nr:transcriptional regulator PtsJ [Massilia terrae]MCS0659456.1 transcriptional regulator PtsJ [Massilia terrae]
MSKTITGSTAIEISDCIRALAQNGDYRPGDLLPPVRELAATLGVNRNTVAAAYQRLAAAGIAVTNGRHGTTISEPPRAGEQDGLSTGSPLIDLADGNPDPQWLADVAKLLADRMPKPFLYGEQTVLPELRSLGETLLAPDCPAGLELELTHGAVDGIERVTAATLVSGDQVAVEDPCFMGTIKALRIAGMLATGVPIDEHGMRPEGLANALEGGARAVLITPRAHNPTGYSLSKRRAQELKRVLADHPNVLVIVDDHFAFVADTPYHSIIPASTTRWAVLRSVSKGLGPDLRLAFLACDAETAARVRTRLAPGTAWVSHILQVIVAAGLASAETRKKIDNARKSYARRRDELHGALAAQGIAVPRSSDGLNVWIPVAPEAKDVAYALAKKGWLVRLGSAFDVQERSRAIRITISKLQDGQAECFAADLAECLAGLA